MSDLIDTGEAIVTTLDFNPPPRERTVQYDGAGNVKGVCRVCGLDAATPSGTYCADHKTRQRAQTEAPSGTPVGTTSVVKPPRSTGRGAPTGDEWASRVFDKLIILLSALLAGSMIRRYGVNDPNDNIADILTMEGDEARRVARPLGRFMAGTKFSKTQGRKVLENSDLLDAGFALYDYWDRVNKTLRQYTSTPTLASVSNIREPEGETNGPVEQQASESGIDFGNLPDITGAHFVP